jgi:hypothetical protein
MVSGTLELALPTLAVTVPLWFDATGTVLDFPRNG